MKGQIEIIISSTLAEIRGDFAQLAQNYYKDSNGFLFRNLVN